MCAICGCGSGEKTLTNMQTGARHEMGAHEHVRPDGSHFVHSHEDHDHWHPVGHGHSQDHAPGDVIELNARILDKNDRAAARNRAWLRERGIPAINLMSAPGAGKTLLLERSIAALQQRRKVFVLEGDQATDHDGARVQKAGAAAVQINTGQGCHLDAEMVARGLAELKPEGGALLFIENVGNLVCPALFDLGESRRVAILSVTEGEDKPLKYPHMFRAADLILINKIDLLPHLDFEVERALDYARQVNPGIESLRVSARTGEGLDRWLDWIAALPLPVPA